MLQICARISTELYSSARQDRHSSQKYVSADTQEVPPILTSEVKKTLKEIKNSKASGIDNLTVDVMILGGDASVKQITNI